MGLLAETEIHAMCAFPSACIILSRVLAVRASVRAPVLVFFFLFVLFCSFVCFRLPGFLYVFVFFSRRLFIFHFHSHFFCASFFFICFFNVVVVSMLSLLVMVLGTWEDRQTYRQGDKQKKQQDKIDKEADRRMS